MFSGKGEFRELVFGTEDRNRSRIEGGIFFSLGQSGVIGQKKTISEVRADGVMDHALPQHGTHGTGIAAGFPVILLSFAYAKDAPHADDDATAMSVLYKGNLFRIKKDQRRSGPYLLEKAVFQSILIDMGLDPGGFELHRGFGRKMESIFQTELIGIFPEKPVERNGRRREGRMN